MEKKGEKNELIKQKKREKEKYLEIAKKKAKKTKVKQELKENLKLKESVNFRENNINVRFKSLFTILAIMSVIGFTIYGFINATNNYKIDKSLSNNIILKVNDEIVDKELFNYYLERGKTYYEKEAGHDIWEATIDGKSAYENLKDSILDTIIQIKVQVDKAKKQGIKITGEEYDDFNASNPNTYREYLEDQIYILKLKEYYTKNYVFDEEKFKMYLNEKEYAEKNTNIYENLKSEFIEMEVNKIYEEDFKVWLMEKEVIVNNKEYSKLVLE